MKNYITNYLDIWTTALSVKSNGRSAGIDNQKHYGIDKLRELILDLAVRGKLVPQDPNDEPANFLLERILKEKEKLVKNGKIKIIEKVKRLAFKEEPFNIPDSWLWTSLAEITIINPRNESEDNSLASFVPMNLISTHYSGAHNQEEKLWSTIKNGFTHFANGDIGLAKITPCFENGKAVIFKNLRNGIGAGTTELHIARPLNNNSKSLNPRYALLYLKSPKFLKTGESRMTGTAGQKRVPKDFFSYYPFSLPPLTEQHRIVARVDELMALCDQLEKEQTENNFTQQALVEALLKALTNSADHNEFQSAWLRIVEVFDTLFTTEYSIEQLKQTILQLAVMGKLVPQILDDEPAGGLIEKIKKEKERLVKDAKIKKGEKLKVIKIEERPYELPFGWIWQKFGDVLDVTSSKRIHVSDYVSSGIPFFRSKEIGELQKGREISSDIFISTNKYEELRRLTGFPKKGDLMLTSVGSIGNTWICDGRDFYYKDGNITKIGFCHLINMHYIEFFINSPLFNFQINNSVSGTAYNALTIIKINNLIFPLPPINEQKRIVDKINELSTLCDALKESIGKSQKIKVQLADAAVEQALK